jgi:hypothetical protein
LPEAKDLYIVNLPFSAVRQQLDPLLEPDFVDQLGIKAYDMIGNSEGFELIQRGDLQRTEFRCAQFVFATNKNESWAKEDEHIEIFRDPLAFLEERGYHPLLRGGAPLTGDVIAYGFLQSRNPLLKLVHLGIIDKDKVISKFNEGHVFRHPKEAVPHHFGTHALFFRK